MSVTEMTVDCPAAEDVATPGVVKCKKGLYGGRPSVGVCEVCNRSDDGFGRLAPVVRERVGKGILPRRLHFVWTGPPMPAWVSRAMERWAELNPKWHCELHGAEVLLPEWRKLYSRLWRLDQRSNLLRMSALRRWGGVYVDLDMVPFCPVDEILADHDGDWDVLLFQNRGGAMLADGFLAVRQDSEVWGAVDDGLAALGGEVARDRLALGPRLWTAVAKAVPGFCRVMSELRYIHCDVGQAGRLAVAESALEGAVDPAIIDAVAECGKVRPYMIHVGTAGGLLRKGSFGVGDDADATAFLPAFVLAGIGPQLRAVMEAEGLSLQIREVVPGKGGYLEELERCRNVISWGYQMPHSRFVEAKRNVLFIENGTLSQRTGAFLDAGGFWTHSDFVRERAWEVEPTDAERAALAAHVKRCFGWEMFAGGDPGGPVLLALQTQGDAPCRYYYPTAQGGDPIAMSLWLCREHLPRAQRVWVRPHPGGRKQFFDNWSYYKQWVAGRSWLVDESPNVYEKLPQARALVTANSTLATEAQALGLPIATLGHGTFTGSGTVLECADEPARLAGVLDDKPDLEARWRFLSAVKRLQLPYHAGPAKLSGHPALRRWVERCREQS